METKINTSFLSSAVQEIEDDSFVAKESVVVNPFIPKKHNLTFWNKVTILFFGLPCQPFLINKILLFAHKEEVKQLVKLVCPVSSSNTMARNKWISLGYDEELFPNFIVAALHLKMIQTRVIRILLYIKPLV